jgi:hypothetical protein
VEQGFSVFIEIRDVDPHFTFKDIMTEAIQTRYPTQSANNLHGALFHDNSFVLFFSFM